LLIFGLYILSLGILGVYGWLSYIMPGQNEDEKMLGPVTAAAVVTIDIILFLLI